MQTKITVILDNPADVDAFEASYPALINDATKLPGLVSLESAVHRAVLGGRRHHDHAMNGCKTEVG